MNIQEELLKEHSLQQASKVCNYVCSEHKQFAELMDCFLSPVYRVAQRAAWVVSLVAKKNPALVKPFTKVLALQLARKDVHNAVIRNSLRILQQLEIPEELHGSIMNDCFAFVESADTPAAIKAFSLTILSNLSHSYPELKHELSLIINERWEHESPAFQSRARQITAISKKAKQH